VKKGESRSKGVEIPQAKCKVSIRTGLFTTQPVLNQSIDCRLSDSRIGKETQGMALDKKCVFGSTLGFPVVSVDLILQRMFVVVIAETRLGVEAKLDV